MLEFFSEVLSPFCGWISLLFLITALIYWLGVLEFALISHVPLPAPKPWPYVFNIILIFVRSISYFNSEFILANIVNVSSNVIVNSRAFFVISPWLGGLGDHSPRLRLKIKLPYLTLYSINVVAKLYPVSRKPLIRAHSLDF